MSAAFSAVGICCRAYDAIEHRPFVEFADGSEEGAFAARHWDASRRYVLAAAPWSFATAYGSAFGSIDVPAPAATPYVVDLAPDCLFFRGIDDVGRPYAAVPFGDRRLRTDVEPPFVYEYTEDVTEPFRFAPAFVEALTLYLAALFAPKWTRSQNRAEILFDRYRAMLDDACVTDARQGTVADHRLSGQSESWTGLSQSQP